MSSRKRVLAIASGGGHFVQLCRLMPAFSDCDLTVASTDPKLAGEAQMAAKLAGCAPPRFCTVTEANRWQRLRMLRSVWDLTALLLRTRPNVIVTTGAAPGFLALLIGRTIGARTVWIDSIANTDQLSLSGVKAGRIADLWLTQWPELATEDGPEYKGAVL